MKKTILIASIIAICFILVLIAVGCFRPIVPGSSFEIIYPKSNAVVPTEFSVLAVAARWSAGVEVQPLLFMSPPKSYVSLSSCIVELSLDGVPYSHSSNGNHHVFRVTAPPGDHTVGLATPYGKTEITVHVTDDPPVVVTPFYGVDTYAESVDALTKSLFDFIQTEPSFSFSGNANTLKFRKIFLTDGGAFILFEAMKEQYLSACEIRYIAPIGADVTADDIAKAPVIFSWDGATDVRPIKLAETVGAGDRLYLVVLDDTALTVFSVFPGGNVDGRDYPLSTIAPMLAESVRAGNFMNIQARANRAALFIALDAYNTEGLPNHFDILVKGHAATTVDLDGKSVDGITPAGGLITLYPASYVGVFDSGIVGDTGSTFVYLPLPEAGDTYSFVSGSVHNARDFSPEHPRFETGPPVVCVDCTKKYVPVHCGFAGDVMFGPDVVKATMAGRESYFIMGLGEGK